MLSPTTGHPWDQCLSIKGNLRSWFISICALYLLPIILDVFTGVNKVSTNTSTYPFVRCLKRHLFFHSSFLTGTITCLGNHCIGYLLQLSVDSVTPHWSSLQIPGGADTLSFICAFDMFTFAAKARPQRWLLSYYHISSLNLSLNYSAVSTLQYSDLISNAGKKIYLLFC